MIHSVTRTKSLILIFPSHFLSFFTKKTFGKAESNALKKRVAGVRTYHLTLSGPLLRKPFENKQC